MDTRIMRIHSRKLPVPRRFYNPSDIFSELGLSRDRNLKGIWILMFIAPLWTAEIGREYDETHVKAQNDDLL